MGRWGRYAARVQRVWPAGGGLVQRVQKGRQTVPLAPKVVAA